MRAALPPGVELHMAFDGSVFVQRSITEAKETLLLTAAREQRDEPLAGAGDGPFVGLEHMAT